MDEEGEGDGIGRRDGALGVVSLPTFGELHDPRYDVEEEEEDEEAFMLAMTLTCEVSN